MFGKNEKVGRRYFDGAPTGSLLVTSIFLTLQGEGPFQGQPALFIRLAKCNLACSFCDTFFDHGDWFTENELIAEVIKRGGEKYGVWYPSKMGVVITGGEPSLQPTIASFLQRLEDGAFVAWTQIETNGVLPINNLPRRTVVVCSPKCIERRGKPFKYMTPHSNVMARANALKFVMSADPDSPYSTVPAYALDWAVMNSRPVYVSPMNIYRTLPAKSRRWNDAGARLVGATPDMQQREDEEVISFWEEGLLNMDQNRLNHEHAARYVLKHGLRLTLQMHLLASLA